MESNQVRESVATISLNDMKVEIDLGEVITKDGPETAQKAATWVVQQYFWSHPSHQNGKLRHEALLAVLNQAKYMALNYMLNEWKDLGERTSIFMLNDAVLTGWHSDKDMSFDTLEDMLSSMLDQNSPAGVSTYTFIVKQLLPAALHYGIQPALLFSVSTQVRKLRELVPTARKILSDETMPDQEKEQNLKYFITRAADNRITHAEFKGETDAFRNKRLREIKKLVGHESIMPNGETWIVIRCPEPFDERVIEMLLQAKVDIHITDWRQLTVELGEMLKDFDTLDLKDPHSILTLLEGRKNGKRGTVSIPQAVL